MCKPTGKISPPMDLTTRRRPKSMSHKKVEQPNVASLADITLRVSQITKLALVVNLVSKRIDKISLPMDGRRIGKNSQIWTLKRCPRYP